jgi:hypothetical protein
VFTPLVDILTFLEANTLVIIKENINDYESRDKSLIESPIPPKSPIRIESRDESPAESPIESPVSYTINSTTEQLEVRPF